MKTTTHPTLPFSTAPIDWKQPVECKFDQLQVLRHTAERNGFHISNLQPVPGGYEVHFKAKAN